MSDDPADRYLYCVVDVADVSQPTFETTGVDGSTTTLVTQGDLGAVVHRCDGIYASDERGEVTGWLLAHQSVVDDAGETFDTPLPFRFDTVVEGDDDAVREWLAEERDTLRSALDALSGHWEYRVEVTTDGDDEAALVEQDEQLRELADRKTDADEGTAFLLERQYDRRLSTLQRDRHAERVASLTDDLAELTREVHETDQDDDGTTRSTTLTMLAPEANESAIGELLDDVVTEPSVEVTFTGPWPPYTFTPSFGEREEEGDGTAP
jgi:hypothetical protein